ncbi:unextended protein isoform X2 [Aethina tumida]|uniref:unextended protein isoform X2 n=1 Tax=Aethina tumida TaxID=116153 RepID=UPI0021494132|nr:unextended protein isoform X2 [Aethina tumida]
MARVLSRRTIHLICSLLLILNKYELIGAADEGAPEFYSLNVIKITDNLNEKNVDYKEVVFEVQGRNIPDASQIKTTAKVSEKSSLCEDSKLNDYKISVVSGSTRFKIAVPESVQGNLYFCLPRKFKENDGRIPPNILDSQFFKWYHQGPNITINVLPSETEKKQDISVHHRSLRDADAPQVWALRLEKTYKDPSFVEGVPEVLVQQEHVIRLIGTGFTPEMVVTFTQYSGSYGSPCELPAVKGFPVEETTEHTTVVKINLPALSGNADSFFICIKPNQTSTFIHQGSELWLQMKTYEKMVPLWAAIVIIIICLSFSSLFSGLNLGLMSLDKTELKILCNTGTSKERKYAKVIQPVRETGNYLLCSILLGNVFVNSIFTILLDDLTSGLIAVIFSTLAIVMFGEISPQAVCSRHGLAIGAKTIWITKVVMVITFPLSYPISKFLDCILGEEIGNVYTRERLKELVKVTTGENDLDKDEVNIISGALELRKKTVSEVMTKIEDVFMLDYEAVLDFETVSEIMKSGYSRVPVYEGNRQNIVTMLYIKDLAFVDPDDNTPLKTLCQFYQNPCNFVFEDVTLDVMFKIFKDGNKGHMAFVHRVNNEGEGDPFYETVGLITLEDVIEELIQAEIMDETDVFTDNRTKRKRNAERRQDFSVFAERRGESSRIRISPQLTLAAYQYLSTTVEPFHPHVISETILRRLLKQDIVFHIKKNKEWRTDPANIIYQQGKAVDYFVIILEGRVEVTVGKENLMFEGGPFTYFGTQALVQTVGIESPSTAPSTMGSLESLNLDSLLRHTFIPDYTVRASTEVLYVKVKRSMYLAAKRATLMERSKRDNDNAQSGENFDEEVDKLLHSLDEDDGGSLGGRQTPRKRSSKNLSHHRLETGGGSHSTSPKTPPHYSSVSPPNRLSSRDINGSINKSSPVDEVHLNTRDEEVSLLPRKS